MLRLGIFCVQKECLTMSAGKLIGYLTAGILIFFGVLFIWATFSPQGQMGWLVIGVISVLIGFGIIWLVSRQAPQTMQVNQNVTMKMQVELSGDVNLEQLKCKACGGTLSPQNVTMLAGAPVVTCPYCNTSYQLTEEPKW